MAKTDPPMLSMVASIVAILRHARLVNWLQDLFPEVAERLTQKSVMRSVLKLLRRLRNWSLNGAFANVTIGESMKRYLHEQGVKSEGLFLIPNWANGRAIRPDHEDAQMFRRVWHLEEKLLVMYSGNMGRAHRLDCVVDAAERLKVRNEIHFLFIGDGHSRKRLQAEVTRRALPNVSFQPFVDRKHLGGSLSAADIHLVSLAPELDGLIVPSKLYGALAAGVPVIYLGSQESDAAQILSSEPVCGTVISPFGTEALADAIMLLADDDLQRATMGSNARKVFEAKFDQEIAFQAWQKLLSAR